jgi:hypothetical protein
MNWKDIPRNPDNRTLRQFAAAWLVFFLFLAGWHGLHRGRTEWGVALAALAVSMGLAGLAWPPLVRRIFLGWMLLAVPIGWLVSQVVLLLLFYVMFTPLALFLRLRGRDVLRLKPPGPDKPTFWQPKSTPADLRRYLRQY